VLKPHGHKHVVVVVTAVGRLLMRRYSKQDGLRPLITDDLAAGFEYLGLPKARALRRCVRAPGMRNS
jgi:hypothetical protein